MKRQSGARNYFQEQRYNRTKKSINLPEIERERDREKERERKRKRERGREREREREKGRERALHIKQDTQSITQKRRTLNVFLLSLDLYH